MSEDVKQEIVAESKHLSKWFEIDLTIKIFGHTIYTFHFPPQKD